MKAKLLSEQQKDTFHQSVVSRLSGEGRIYFLSSSKNFLFRFAHGDEKWWFQGLNNNLFCHSVSKTRWQDVQVGDVSIVSKKLSIGLQMVVDCYAIARNCVAFLQESRSFQKKSKFNKTAFSHSFLSNIDIIGNLWRISRENSFLFVDNWSILQVSSHSSVQEYFLNRSCQGFRYKSVTALRFPEVVLVGNW